MFTRMRYAGAVAALLAPFLLAGCGSGSGSSSASAGGPKKITVGLVFDKGGIGDKSFNDSANAGLQRAIKDLGVTGKTVESKSETDYEPNLDAFAEANYDLVIAVGISMKDAVEACAKKYPNAHFAIVDASINAPNVRSLLFKEEEGSFLAGYVAGLTTKTGKIGFVGGMDLPIIRKFQYGYQAGALAANPKIQFEPAKFTGDWVNVDLGKASAHVLYGDGADIVFAAAGRAGLGVISEAADANKWAIGVDSDQDAVAPGHVLTSMVKHVDNALFDTIQDVAKGSFTAGDRVYDLKAGGVGLTEMKYTRGIIGTENLKKVADEQKAIVDGKIVVPSTEAEFEKFRATVK